MKFFGKKYFILLTGLLFVTSVSLDPLYHEFVGAESSPIECQLCKNEVSDPIKSTVGIVKVSLSTILKVENLLDEVARNHSSFVKDQAPLPGRNIGIRLNFIF